MRRASGLTITVMLILLFVTGCSTINKDLLQSGALSTQTSDGTAAQNGATGSQKENPKQLVVDGEKIQFDTISIMSDKVTLKIPATFSIMSEDLAKMKYPSENRPSVIYANDDGSVNIAFNYTQNQASSENIQAITDAIKESFENELHPNC